MLMYKYTYKYVQTSWRNYKIIIKYIAHRQRNGENERERRIMYTYYVYTLPHTIRDHLYKSYA